MCNMNTTSNFNRKWLMGQIDKHRETVLHSRCLIHCFLKINFKLIDTHLKNGNSSICLSDGIYQ